MSEYTYRKWRITSHMMESIKLYVSKGIEPGHFLSAVMCNDFVKAIMYADDTNIQNLPAFGAYLYNEVPSNAWGSYENFEFWVRKGGHKGIYDQEED